MGSPDGLYAHIHRSGWGMLCYKPTHYTAGRKPVVTDPVLNELPGAWKAFLVDGALIKTTDAVVCGSCGQPYQPHADNCDFVPESDWPAWYAEMQRAQR
jgi:hypothetical protein